MSFFSDAFGDKLIGGGQVTLVARTTLYVSGLATTEVIKKLNSKHKSLYSH